jgi:hypothetical protein
MRKKQSQVAKVQALLSQNANMSAKEMAEKLKLPISRVYVLRSMAKKKQDIGEMAHDITTGRKGSAKAYRENLEIENKKLTDWTMLWKQKCDKQESEIARIQHLYMDSQAVVRYLETKLITLVQGK